MERSFELVEMVQSCRLLPYEVESKFEGDLIPNKIIFPATKESPGLSTIFMNPGWCIVGGVQMYIHAFQYRQRTTLKETCISS